jgi:hypothetical protein
MYIGVHVIYRVLYDFNDVNFLDSFSVNTKISNTMKILPVGTELLHADGRTDRHDEANNHFCNFVSASKMGQYCGISV